MTIYNISFLILYRGEVKDKVTDVVPSFDLLIPKHKEDGAPSSEDVSTANMTSTSFYLICRHFTYESP